MTRFSQSGALENFQVDGGAPVQIPMMQQENYPVKMGVDSDLRCTVGAATNELQVFPSQRVKVGSPPADHSDPDAERHQHVRLPA